MKSLLKLAWNNKVLWVNVLAVLAAAVGYIIDNELAPKWVPWLGLILIVIDSIVVILKEQAISALKKESNVLRERISQLMNRK